LAIIITALSVGLRFGDRGRTYVQGQPFNRVTADFGSNVNLVWGDEFRVDNLGYDCFAGIKRGDTLEISPANLVNHPPNPCADVTVTVRKGSNISTITSYKESAVTVPQFPGGNLRIDVGSGSSVNVQQGQIGKLKGIVHGRGSSAIFNEQVMVDCNRARARRGNSLIVDHNAALCSNY